MSLGTAFAETLAAFAAYRRTLSVNSGMQVWL
jgi:hypothetical protein